MRVFFLILLVCFTSCTIAGDSFTGYNFNNPQQTLELPEILHEISGITLIEENIFACIQDENGILFLYDAVLNKIVHQYTFHIDGDYEGITKVKNTIYVLRSDGKLFEINDFNTPEFELNSYNTGIPANNNEGLCYESANNRLLIACKGKLGKGREFKDRRVIYSFDLQTKKLSSEPVYDFDIRDIKQFSVDQGIKIPVKLKKKGQIKDPIIKFRTSAIAIHPVSQKLYLLSASDHMLFVFDKYGRIEHIELLDKKIYNKAEGISFFDNGDMLISNEGQDKKPSLIRLKYELKP